VKLNLTKPAGQLAAEMRSLEEQLAALDAAILVMEAEA
jgi:hypothetical protein